MAKMLCLAIYAKSRMNNLKKEKMLIDNNGIFTVSLAELR